MPENYSLTTDTYPIVTTFCETTSASTTGEVKNPYIVEYTPDTIEIVGTAPFHYGNGEYLKLLTYDLAPFTKVDRLIFNPPATIVFWEDGTKTVVKCAKGEAFSEYNGFAAALLKKIFGSNSAVKKIIQRKKQYAAPAKANSNSAKDADLEQRFKELVNEYEHLKNRAENLNLYLRKVETTFPVTWLTLLDAFSNMPGYESIVEKSHGN